MFGKHHTEETRRKISESLLGHIPWNKGIHHSQATCKKIGVAVRGKIPWNKGKKGIYSEETRKRMSQAAKGKKKRLGAILSSKTKKKIAEKAKGRKHTSSARIKMSHARAGKNSRFWMGGISFEPYCPKFNRNLKERIRIFFGRKCFRCGKSEKEEGIKLHAHHVNYNKMACCNDIKPLFVALCKVCHNKTNHNRERWENYFELELMKRTRGKCYYTEEEMKFLGDGK